MHRSLRTLALLGAMACSPTNVAPPAEGVCGPLEVACGTLCVDLQSDEQHCGGCGNQCTDSASCVEARCALACEPPGQLCVGACVDVRTNTEHCGVCGNACAGGMGAQISCEDGACTYACQSPFEDCNGEISDGCERDVSADVDHCGACAARCLGAAHAEPACESQACVLGDCDDDFDNCDGDANTGCETSLLSSMAHCGGCNAPCASAFSCSSGSCAPLRPNVLLCGLSAHDVSDFLPAGVPLTLLSSCSADVDTQAMLVTRNGTANLIAQDLVAYVQGGGIVLGELGNSDEIFSMLFSPVNQGLFQGGCADNIATVVQHSPNDTFWASNTFTPIDESLTGCGWDLSSYPGTVPLAGWSANTVSLAYRDFGSGRAWLVEADWQDGGRQHTEQTRALMGQMMLTR